MNSTDKIWAYLEAQDKCNPLADQLIHWISGYAYGQTEVGDHYIALFHPHEKMIDKVVKVYDHDWSKLPAFIERPTKQSKTFKTGSRTQTPQKESLRDQRLYNECFVFQIMCYLEQPGSTGLRQRRFSKVLLTTQKHRQGYKPVKPANNKPTFESMEAAIRWTMDKLNIPEAEAITFYTSVKEFNKPNSPTKMWVALDDAVKMRLAKQGDVDAFTPMGKDEKDK